MTNEQLAAIAKILGVSEENISAMDETVRNDMQRIFETAAIKNDDDKKAVYETLDQLWQKGVVLDGLNMVAETSGISVNTLRKLDFDTQQALVYECMMDSSQTERFYELTNKALAVIELDKVSKLTGVPVRELRKLPVDIQERLCGAYTMEYDKDSTNEELINELREMIEP